MSQPQPCSSPLTTHPTLRSTRVHVVVIAPTFSLVSPSSRHPIVVVALVRPSRTYRRFHPIRYRVPLLTCSYCLCSMHSSAQVPLLHRRAPTELLFDFGATGCTLVCATATDVLDGRAGLAMVGEVGHSWLGFWRGWLGRAHLSGMYPSLLHNRSFDACSTSSLQSRFRRLFYYFSTS